MPNRTQNLLFTLYGDYLQHRGGEAWVGSLIEIMSCFGASDQAVRSTLSRMSSRGWFRTRQHGRNSYYSLTPKGAVLLREGVQRIFHPRKDPWDGKWLVVIYQIDEKQRELRNRLRERLAWLGFGRLNQSTWISPHDCRQDVEVVLDELQVRRYVETFYGVRHGRTSDREIVERCWNTKALTKKYAEFISRYEPQYQSMLAEPDLDSSREHFTRRFELIHEYRQLPYIDPNLPADLLPDDWLGDRAQELFQSYHSLLTRKAEAFVDDLLIEAPAIDKLLGEAVTA
ncbi:MAG: phenylacetic acid degradation operon negative regulatory protein PaaX [Chloroflexota bacterium]|nr:MAG: phenylacetic acid degradation operon negative regulatory protein PaaX [Chloroflexota bacterium]